MPGDRLYIRLGKITLVFFHKEICTCGSIKNIRSIRTLILAKNPKDQNESNSGSNSKRYEW